MFPELYLAYGDAAAGAGAGAAGGGDGSVGGHPTGGLGGGGCGASAGNGHRQRCAIWLPRQSRSWRFWCGSRAGSVASRCRGWGFRCGLRGWRSNGWLRRGLDCDGPARVRGCRTRECESSCTYPERDNRNAKQVLEFSASGHDFLLFCSDTGPFLCAVRNSDALNDFSNGRTARV